MHIEALPVEEFKILKVIQVEGPEWNRFTAYLPYTRTFDPTKQDGNGHDQGDALDAKLLSVLQEQHPRSFLRYNVNVFFTGELENVLRVIEGGTSKDVTIQFFPLIPYQELHRFAGREFTAYPMPFRLRMHLGIDNPRLDHITEFFLCHLPYDQVDALVKTIQPL